MTSALEVHPAIVDFPEVYVGEPFEGSFLVTNRGEGEVNFVVMNSVVGTKKKKDVTDKDKEKKDVTDKEGKDAPEKGASSATLIPRVSEKDKDPVSLSSQTPKGGGGGTGGPGGGSGAQPLKFSLQNWKLEGGGSIKVLSTCVPRKS